MTQMVLSPFSQTITANSSNNLDSANPTGAGGGSAWQLASTNYISQKLTGVIISPRPDSETDTNSTRAYYRKNHSQVTYRVRICVVGMAWPFKYTLTTAPTGTTIGSELDRSTDGATSRTLHQWGTDYAVVECSPANMGAGTASFTAQVEGQDGATQTVSWTSARDDTAFVFVDAGVAGSDVAAGTYAAPLETFAAGLWESSDSANTYAGKIAVFRTGTYDVGNGTAATNVTVNTSVKPATYMAFPGEVAALDFSDSHMFSNGTTQEDLSIIGLELTGGRSVQNVKLFSIGSAQDRLTWWNNTFKNVTNSTGGGDNPSCVFISDSTTRNEYVAFADNVLESTVTMQAFCSFSTQYTLVENNLCNQIINATANVNGNYHLNIKDDTSYCTVRANVIDGATGETAIRFHNQNGLSDNTDQECCWNTVITAATRDIDSGILWNGHSGSSPTVNIYDYRNSIVNTKGTAYRILSKTPETPILLSASVYFGDSGDNNGGSGFTDVAPLGVSLVLADFTAAGKLTGTSRTSYLGTKGAEVAG